MEDIRPYRIEENDRRDADYRSDNPIEWELAATELDDEVPFHIPRD